MHIRPCLLIACLLLTFAAAAVIDAQVPDTAALLAAQKEAMKPFSQSFGIWRGTAWHIGLDGVRRDVIQTERAGPFLDGSVLVFEGRGYDVKTGKVTFNAFGTIFYDVKTKLFTLHSHAQGQTGDFRLTPTADGYIWEIPAGPVTIKYTATIKNGSWHEVGDRLMPGKDPVRFFEMTLKRIGDTDWPAGGAVPMK